jgi:hypothetical protein
LENATPSRLESWATPSSIVREATPFTALREAPRIRPPKYALLSEPAAAAAVPYTMPLLDHWEVRDNVGHGAIDAGLDTLPLLAAQVVPSESVELVPAIDGAGELAANVNVLADGNSSRHWAVKTLPRKRGDDARLVHSHEVRPILGLEGAADEDHIVGRHESGDTEVTCRSLVVA